MNKIVVDLQNILIALPENKIIVERSEYEELSRNSSQGRYMTLSEVLELLSVSRPWLLDNVLYKSEIRKEIDIDKNKNGFVKYPDNQGGRYFFLASKTKEYFEKNFAKLLKL
ncbi:DUF771 domain-containing protein [Streptococcus acidominimus]|uniref:DUF771 domain-containing protein n=1 Tax=Streptococcus acidominimus TaxID=1326 RepID=A0A4Y9FL63_STRAI|nr:DUF771 domain-containing protein [Streptococcus acidominimus]MBF0819681.1 DUF771 domain-containing protein [Streptococcus acidominimus]MBF0838478.1 DUF771 domain-containing protein [Streptococcus acidominimus]MBF0847308.1 DUF771 domain-containing protein [Streptococcus danieliae]TFU29592.1 DUF771 domain-containing protein [Streptococcus acidominimus]